MQIDFHYYTIKVLAEKAGFDKADAQMIAYASQYVDDATEHNKIELSGDSNIKHERFTGNIFDPICTAHKGIQRVLDFSKGVQYKVYVPFHFVPYKEAEPNQKFDYVVKPNGNLVNQLMKIAVSQYKQQTEIPVNQSLIKLGIAIHSFTDSFSHHGFSGRQSSEENDIEDIHIFENNKWNKISSFQQVKLNLLPSIGHAEAHRLADKPHLIWKYKQASTGAIIERNNTEMSLQGAQLIYNYLHEIKAGEKWENISEKIKSCFSTQGEKEARIEAFTKTFPEIDFDYHPDLWRNEALAEPTSDKKWFLFHIEAHKQREFIISKMP